MADNKFPGEFDSQDPLEKFLDEETDEEFGLPEFKDHFADSLTPAVLKDWTAADFASIYVRFRPHLERHARRFLVNPSQVEEVVQDAFLYLMTTLPELDSELGVLKFLKWKTRLLALDVIRANSRASFAPIDEQPEFAAKGEELSADLERADDAAIVALAMAKLQPRHREALIATLYEEKSNEVVAAQMGLNENAFRQLLFRARSAFKKALVGEAETAGKSVSEILSIAARKAAKESGKYISAAGAFLLVLAISIGVIPNLSQPAQEQFADQVEPTFSSPGQQLDRADDPYFAQPSEDSDSLTGQARSELAQGVDTELASTLNAPQSEAMPSPDSVELAAVSDSPSDRELHEALILEALDEFALATLSTITDVQDIKYSDGILYLANGRGLTARVLVDPDNGYAVQDSWFEIQIGDAKFYSVPKMWLADVASNSQGHQVINYLGAELIIGDAYGDFGHVVTDKTPITRSSITMQIVIDPQGNILRATLDLNEIS